MFTSETLRAQFGEWTEAYWPVVQPLFEHYHQFKCHVAFSQSRKQHEAVLTIKLVADDRNQAKWLDINTVRTLRATSNAFKRQCLEIACEVIHRNNSHGVKVEFTLADPTALDSAELDARHRSMAWKPSKELLTSLMATCKQQFDYFMQTCEQLTPPSKNKVRDILQLYCVSSEKTLPPKLAFVPDQPHLLIVSNVKHTSLTWWTYLLEQVDLGVEAIQLHNNELIITLNPPLQFNTSKEMETAHGPMRKSTRKRDSLIGRIKRRVWPW